MRQSASASSSNTGFLREADPLALVDEPLNKAESVECLTLAEREAQSAREAILQECISLAEAARLSGRSRQNLDRLRLAGCLLALRVGTRWLYPRWQFTPDISGGIVLRFGEVLQQLAL